MKFTINNVCGNVMYEVEADSFLNAVEQKRANLWDAILGGANLRGAKNISRYLTTPLYLLLDQPGKIRAYKLINKQGEGPFNGGINYLKTK